MHFRHAFAYLACLAGCSLLAVPAADAAEGTEIASAMDDDDPFDIYIGIDYEYAAKRAAIKREFAGPEDGVADGPMPVVKDLLYFEDRHTITPHVQIGVFHDIEIQISLPIVINNSRHYDFDQREDPCVFSGDDANCTDENNSRTFTDGILPSGGGMLGYDAGDPTTNFSPGSKRVFNAVDRAGLDQIHLGLAWAPMNQERDDTKPTWVIGGEFRLSIGEPMRFDKLNPSREDGAGRGFSEFRAYTSLSKRTPWAEPFVTFFWQSPLPMDGDDPTDPESNRFWNVGFGQDSVYPQQQAGTTFGFNGIPWQNQKDNQYLAIEVRANATAHFEGRGYSEMWEIFAYGGDFSTDTNAPLRVDIDPTMATDVNISHPGVTTIENYLTFGGRLGLRGQMGDNAKFNASFAIDYDQSHRISWTDAGKELPTCNANRTTNCEDDSNDVVTPGSKEVNPLFNRTIDLPGRRYLVDESVTYVFVISGTLMF